MNELALFAGAGGGILGGKLLGWRTVCAVELDSYCAGRLVDRQNEGHLDPFPIWDDVRTFDGTPWRGVVDVVSGGFPCQDISAAGKGAGITGERSGLWREMARIIGEVRPRFVLVENSPLLVGRGLAVVLGDLASMGYDARWGIVGAHHAGAPHKRDRIWILANTKNANDSTCNGSTKHIERSQIKLRRSGCDNRNWIHSENTLLRYVCDANGSRLEKWKGVSGNHGKEFASIERANWWKFEPSLGRVAHGVANRVDRLRAIGNGQVPAVVRLAWQLLTTWK